MMPTIGTAELGILVAGIALLISVVVMVLTGINQWKRLFAPPPVGTEYVTTVELDRVEARLKAEIIRVDQEQTKRTTDLDLYCRQQFHELRNQLQEIHNKLASIPVAIRTAIDTAIQPLTIKVDRASETIIRISTLLEIQAKEERQE